MAVAGAKGLTDKSVVCLRGSCSGAGERVVVTGAGNIDLVIFPMMGFSARSWDCCDAAGGEKGTLIRLVLFCAAFVCAALADALARANIAEVGRMRSNGAHSSLGRLFDVLQSCTGVVFARGFTDSFGEMGGGNFQDPVLLV
jgi:hypothetical protein